MLLEMTENSAPSATAPVAPPPVVLLQLLFGKHITYSLSALARLGVADHMSDVPADVETLAAKVGAQPAALYRVMRMLASVGAFEETSGKCFRLTEAGALLRTDAPGSFRYLAIQLGDPWSTRCWERFTDTLRTGTDAVTLTFGKNVFDLFAEEPEQAEHFNRSMTGLSAFMTEPILRAYDFSTINRLADVGGGHGRLLAAVLDKNPRMNGVVYDLPEVVAGAPGQPHLAKCADRIRFESGSFFERVPSGCDAYMLKFILHDWSDEHCKTILQCIRQQLPPDGRVLVIDQIINSDAAPSPVKLLDIEMLALTVGGRERTAQEFRELFAAAGLKLVNVFRTESPVCVLEARPA
ncbi:MAG TPA: methyltransferase [Bryobacteraceae bacterium]|jgi:hypothetical protein